MRLSVRWLLRRGSSVVGRGSPGERFASSHRRVRAGTSSSRRPAATPTGLWSSCAGDDRSSLFVLGVSRSGTTLLRVILDRSPGIAIPDETFFIPQLAHRHPGTVDVASFLDDLRRLPRLAAWEVAADEFAARLRPGMRAGEAIGAVFSAYAAKHGKPRWGDKTPMYMRHLGLIEELFPDAQYVHLIRDGRDAALAFLDMPSGVVTKTWAHPRSAAGFACEWRTEVRRAQALGRKVDKTRYLEVRYEELVADTEGVIRSICDFAALPFEPAMLEYAGAVDVSEKPHHQRLLQPPTRGVRTGEIR